MKKPRVSWLCHVICLFVFVTVSFAQAQNLSVNGCVEDSTKSLLPGASVILTDANFSKRLQTQTNDAGCFRLTDVGAGVYRLTILAEAFAPYETELDLKASQELPTVVLEVAPIRNTVVVSATRTPTPLMSIGLSVDVIDRTQIEASQSRIALDVLRSVGGLAIMRSGDIGGITSVFTRGGESDYTKVLLDGIPVNQPGGIYDYSHLMTDNLSRIEVVRGPQSALFGSDAISGVVQLFTKNGSGPTEVEYSAEGGSFDTTDQRVGLRGGWKKLDFANTFSRFDTDNIGRNNDYRNASYLGNVGFTPNPNHSLRATLMHGSVKAGTPGVNAPGYVSFGPNNRMSRLERAAGLTYAALVGQRVTQHVAYRLYDHDQFFYSAFGTSTVLHTRHRFEYHGDVAIAAAGTLSYGIDYDREDATVATARHFRNNTGYYVQQQLNLGRKLDITAGVRIEDNTTFGTSGNPRLAVSYRLLPATRVRFNAGTGIKEPSFIENFSQSRFFLGNPSLLAERSRSWEVGVEQSFWHERFTADLTWFDSRFRNVIELVRQPDGSSRYDNIGRSRARGTELRLSTRWRRLAVKANHTYLDGRIQESMQTSFPYRTGDPLLRRPRHSGDVTVWWSGSRWSGSWSTRYIGRRADSDFFTFSRPLFSNGPYWSSNAAAGFDLHRSASVFVRLENIFDRSFQEVLGYQALGRSAVVGIRLRTALER